MSRFPSRAAAPRQRRVFRAFSLAAACAAILVALSEAVAEPFPDDRIAIAPDCLEEFPQTSDAVAEAVTYALRSREIAIAPDCGSEPSLSCPGGVPDDSSRFSIVSGTVVVSGDAETGFSYSSDLTLTTPAAIPYAWSGIECSFTITSPNGVSAVLQVAGDVVFRNPTRLAFGPVTVTGVEDSDVAVFGGLGCSFLVVPLSFFAGVVEDAVSEAMPDEVCRECGESLSSCSLVPDDFTGDGRSDLLWRQPSTGKNVWWAMNGTSRLGYGYLLDVAGSAWGMAGTGEFNADGNPDLVWRNASTGQNVVWRMTGTTRTSYASLLTVPSPWEIGGVGDFDKDGDADIVWRNPSTGQNVLWTMNEITRVSYASMPSVPGSQWRIVGTGDFDKDGDADVVWRNGSTGQNVIWFMNGATRVSYAATLTVADPAWRIQAVADYDGDGDADLFWRNVTTGQNVIWLMNGATRVSYASTLPVTEASWEAQGPK